MAIPVPPHFNYAAEPLVSIEINDDWYSVLQGIFDASLDESLWDGDESDYNNIHQALVGIMTLGSIIGTGESMALAVGSYTGNGAATQAITGLGFSPAFLVVYMKISGDTNRGLAFRSTADGNATSINGNSGEFNYNNRIQSLDADGFTVDFDGTTAQFNPNESAKNYGYLALG